MSANNSGETGSWRAFAQVNVIRSFMLMTGGALVGVVLAGYTLFKTRESSTLVVPAEDVALVNQQPISRSDYLTQFKILYGVDLRHATPGQRRKVLDDMIREELFVQRAKELDVAAMDPEVRAAAVNAVELEIAADAITAQSSEAQLLTYYRAHRDRYSSEGIMTVRDMVFPLRGGSVSKAIVVLKGAPPTPQLLAQWNARDSGKGGNEEFYFAAKIHLGDRLFDIARQLSDGGVSAPTEMADGIHVLYMVRNKMPAAMDFARAREQVLNDFRNEAIKRLNTGDEAFLRKRANVLIADDLR